MTIAAVALATGIAVPSANAQRGPLAPPAVESASVAIAAGQRYQASAVHRWFAGGTYRDLWAMPMRVPVLDLHTFAGGVHPTKEGGGMQTKSLRLKTADGVEYVFRLTDKNATGEVGQLKNTISDRFLQDQVSAMHPAGAQISAPIMAAVGVLHPTGAFVVMADDSLLGKFRDEFGGRLGIVEEFPNVPEHGRGFRGASKIIDSGELLKLLNADAKQQIDARMFLTARLVDFLINDNDRHEGNWKWARLESGPKTEWQPIARDRDHAFVSYNGFILSLARFAAPSLVTFGDVPDVDGLTQSGKLDARLLAGLEKPAWDSVAQSVQARITDAVIREAAGAMPAEYQESSAKLQAALKSRRAALPKAADTFYEQLAARVLVHGTDSADRANIVRSSDGIVDVRLESRGKPFFSRRFDARETSEILVYLHDGNDTAVVTGHVQHSILVRVIGGNGTNTFVDSSSVAEDAHSTRFYDAGTVTGVSYGLDTLFDRRPWELQRGVLTPPRADQGASFEPLAGLSVHRLIGITPRIGIVRNGYGFDHRPYDTMVSLEGEYGFEFEGASVRLAVDKRLESSPIHYTAFARMSDLELVSFHGLGNATVDAGRASPYYEVRQRQWLFNPAIALTISPMMDVSLGPVIQHSVTDGDRSPYLAASQPYGVGTFDQVGAHAGARYGWRDTTSNEEQKLHTFLADVDAYYYPAMMSVRAPFEVASVGLGSSNVLGIPTHPLLVVRAGGKKVYGDFPFYEAATIGGEGTTRYMDTQRYAGDASIYATSELRIPVADFRFVLPLRVGVMGLAEAGRVYEGGSSPGGWHQRTGEGLWLGMRGVASVITLARTTEPGHTGLQLRFGLNDAR